MALLVSGALALTLADHLPWQSIYLMMAAIVGVIMLFTLWAKEPETYINLAGEGAVTETLKESIIGPFREFFTRFSGILGLALLAFIGLFKISDQMLGVMAFPFYLDSGFSKTQIAGVSKLFGVWVSIAGAFIGGAVAVKLGAHRTLFIGMVIGAVSNLLFVLLAYFPGNISVFVAVIGGENLAGGFLGAAAVAWLSALVNKGYTATQYALFSSLVALPGKLVGGFSGFMVVGMGYIGFFILSAAAVIPAVMLFFWLSPRIKPLINQNGDER
jgi:PAT family beta-lactamase induction signal transducer AmpG